MGQGKNAGCAPSHYFDARQASASRPREVSLELPGGGSLRLLADSGVFSKGGVDFGTMLLIKALPKLRGRMLDLGCGYGPIGISAAAANPGADVWMSDVNERAVRLCRDNWRRCLPIRGGEADMRILESDGFSCLDGLFDIIATNPPIRAGKATVHALLAGCRERLSPGGELYAVIRNQQGLSSFKAELCSLFGPGAVTDTARKAGYHVLRAAAPNELAAPAFL